jgi:hypothetical protein
VNEDFMLHFFTDLDYLRGEIAAISCVFRNPVAQPSAAQVPEGFEFIGYDLLAKDSGITALTNCRGFPKAFSNNELSEKGLLLVPDEIKAERFGQRLRKSLPSACDPKKQHNLQAEVH